MTEAARSQPPRDEALNTIVKNILGNFVVAKIRKEFSKVFPGACAACKTDIVTYSLTAQCASPTSKPAGTLSWTCKQQGTFTFSGSPETIVDKIIRMWEQKN